jgi:hypothetical protein
MSAPSARAQTQGHTYKAYLGCASFTAVLFPLGIPVYYMLSLFRIRMRAAINPSLHVIMKDKDYIAPWTCPPGRIFIDELWVSP